jgi:hypothetical protein
MQSALDLHDAEYGGSEQTPVIGYKQWRTERGGGGSNLPPLRPRNSEVLTKPSQIPSSVENISLKT